MATTLNPYLTFNGTARQAMELYRDAFGGTLELSTFGANNVPNIAPELVMHASLRTDNGLTLMASDTPEEMPYEMGTAISISLSGGDEPQLRGYWEKLSSGGQIVMPLEKQMWGDVFGACIDRFGIPWMVNITAAKP